jgi:hypothetical protein
MGPRPAPGPPQGDEKRLLFSTTLPGSTALPLSSPTGAQRSEGPAVRRLLLGNVFRQSIDGPAADKKMTMARPNIEWAAQVSLLRPGCFGWNRFAR